MSRSRVRTHDAMIGIRPDFDDGSVAENARAGFEVVAVDGDGKRVALSGLTYSWVREDTTYQWYQKDGSWKYEAITRDRLMTSGKVDIAAGAPAETGAEFPLWLLPADAHRSEVGHGVVLPFLFGLGGEFRRRPAGPHSGRRRQALLPDRARRPTARRWSSWRATRCSPPR